MNRRSFFTKLGLAAATLAILPSATTYARNWVAPSAALGRVIWMPNPEWVNAPYEIAFVEGSHIVIDASKSPVLQIPYRYVREMNNFRQVDPFIKVKE